MKMRMPVHTPLISPLSGRQNWQTRPLTSASCASCSISTSTKLRSASAATSWRAVLRGPPRGAASSAPTSLENSGVKRRLRPGRADPGPLAELEGTAAEASSSREGGCPGGARPQQPSVSSSWPNAWRAAGRLRQLNGARGRAEGRDGEERDREQTDWNI
ncbi:hypothetical protein HaLaN_00675 [Haematococcus lacustris]|uniref:Uncharacterized protein n=1 Tax=Haematococcus lacustris TaxID=44745 RepID=A0A699YSM0_HAELA|nr:hypothetical protein HaLaN_00675 [Haematococcus lacustris]